MNEPTAIMLSNPYGFRIENDCAPNLSVSHSRMVSSLESEDDCAPTDNPPLFTWQANPGTDGGSENYPSIALTRLQITPHLYTDSLPHNFVLAIGPFSPLGPVVLNLPAFNRLQDFQMPQQLEQAVDYTLAEAGLLLPVEQKPKVTQGQPITLTAWLHITNACNLDCPYCYIQKSNARMTDEVGRKVVKAVFESAEKNGFQAVKLKYAGGEAVLHFQLVQRLHAHAQRLATEKGLDLQAVVLSNGTIWTPAMARWLVDNGVKLMISLDGVGKAHDIQRPTRGGKGSFARIEKVVDNILLPTSVRPGISITVTARNSSAAADAVAWAIERDLPFSLSFYRENMLSARFEDLQLEETQIIKGLRKVYEMVERYLPTRPFLNGLLDRVQAEAHTLTCGVGQSYLVFTHTGQVAQCQMHLDRRTPFNGSDDVFDLVAGGSIPIINVEDKEGCRECLWRYRCAGGCPLETYRATGRYDVKSPHCNIYQTLWTEAMRLEGLRLLKLEGYHP